MTWVEFCDSVFNTIVKEWNLSVVTSYFETDGDGGVCGDGSVLTDGHNSSVDDDPDFDEYNLGSGPIDGYIYYLESDGS